MAVDHQAQQRPPQGQQLQEAVGRRQGVQPGRLGQSAGRLHGLGRGREGQRGRAGERGKVAAAHRRLRHQLRQQASVHRVHHDDGGERANCHYAGN